MRRPTIASTGAPIGVAVGFPSRFALRRPVKRNVEGLLFGFPTDRNVSGADYRC